MRWNDIKDYIDLASVEEALGLSIEENGDEHTASCPLSSHAGVDSNPSFSINSTKLVYHCFSCGGSGTVLDLVCDIEGLDKDGAVAWLRSYTKGAFLASDPEAFLLKVERLLSYSPTPEKDQFPLYSPRVLDKWREQALTGEGSEFYHDRGIPSHVVEELQLGYDLFHQEYYKHFGELKSHVGPAAIIPIYNETYLVGYQERWIDRPEGLPKYTNTPNLPKRHILYNFDIAMEAKLPVVVVESPLTAAYIYGITHMFTPVATFGGDVTPEQINLLRNFQNVYLAFDNDATGQMGLGKVGRALMRTSNVFVVPFVDKEKGDLNDVDEDTVMRHIYMSKPASLHFAQALLGKK